MYTFFFFSEKNIDSGSLEWGFSARAKLYYGLSQGEDECQVLPATEVFPVELVFLATEVFPGSEVIPVDEVCPWQKQQMAAELELGPVYTYMHVRKIL